MAEKKQMIRADEAQVLLLDKMLTKLMEVEKETRETTRILAEGEPEGIIEPIHPITVTTTPTIVTPPHRDKLWFSVTIVKDALVEVNIIINTGISGTTPYTMGVDETVYDQYFNRPCIYDVQLWTESGACTVKVRGSR